ncbi:MAG: hypothetical protein E7397_01220 [Ruminococcaceae bacterium]|nr:hypothetical protein [Oscillospiraceae bacterium]
MTRKWRNLAAQIMIVTILLPFVAILTGLFFSDIQSVNDFIDKMINFIPMFDTISNVIFNFSVNMAAEQYTQLTMYILVSDFFEAIVLGVTIDVCKRISKLTALEHLAILKVFLIFVGVLIGGAISGWINLLGNRELILGQIGVIAIMFLGFRFMLAPILGLKFFGISQLIGVLIEAVFAVILACYLTVITVVAKGDYTSVESAIRALIIVCVATVIGFLITTIVDG